MEEFSNTLYTSKIIKAGALIDDTKTMLANWDTNQSADFNLSHLQNDNVFGKATRSRIEDILVVFRQRYLRNPEIMNGLMPLINDQRFSVVVNRILYYFSAKSDQLLFDAVTQFIYSKKEQGINEITPFLTLDWISQLVVDNKTTTDWSDVTRRRCARGLLSTMRDFGVLEGANSKRIAPMYLPIESFSFIAFYLFQNTASGEWLINNPDWRLFFLSEKMVERFLMEAHQHHLLEYYAAGTVIRLTFPSNSLEDYAGVIAQRTN
jgi:hypothetical protein